jgi:signal peptidase I
MSEPVELSAALLRGVAALWKKTNRQMSVRFGGNSMRPTIAPGQEVLMRCTDDVSVGDVIVYVYLDQVVVHRLIARGKQWLLTRGDAHTIPDPPLEDASAIVGKIIDVASPPRSVLRSIASIVTKTAGVFGPRAIRASIAVMRALR